MGRHPLQDERAIGRGEPGQQAPDLRPDRCLLSRRPPAKLREGRLGVGAQHHGVFVMRWVVAQVCQGRSEGHHLSAVAGAEVIGGLPQLSCLAVGELDQRAGSSVGDPSFG